MNISRTYEWKKTHRFRSDYVLTRDGAPVANVSFHGICRDVALTPLLDLLRFGAQFVPYVDDSVTWRGYRVRPGPNTLMLTDSAAA